MQNALAPNPALRALLVALDDWVSDGQEAARRAACHVARRARWCRSLPQAKVGFPAIPGVTYNGLARTGDLFDFGPSLDQGILTVLPPTALGTPYPVLVPKTDADGNDVAGIRLPAVAVPMATYTGWALRAAAFAGDDLCDASGQQIAFLHARRRSGSQPATRGARWRSATRPTHDT